MSFTRGFSKLAAGVLEQGAGLVKMVGKGVAQSGNSTIKDALKLKGLGHISQAAKASGGIGKSLSTPAGRARMAKSLGKAAPSVGALGLYGVGAKKIYDKASEGNGGNQGYY